MLAALLGALTVVVFGGACVAVDRHRRARWLQRRVHRRVIVHTIEDQTIDALLVAVEPDGLVLANAQFMAPSVGVAGELWVPRDKVRFVQHPEAP